VKKLHTLSEAVILDNLAAATRSVGAAAFTIGGTALSAPISLVYSSKNLHPQGAGSEASSDAPPNFTRIAFPADPAGPEVAALQAACAPAPFGRGAEAVLDPAVRSALALLPEDFSTQFSLAEHPEILGSVHRIMMPDAIAIGARLDKLNVYPVGGFFQPHVDTPRDASVFGSLVVCLSVAHSGGGLVVRHGKESVAYEWGENAGKGAVQWAALYR
jgi:hypothetical protein